MEVAGGVRTFPVRLTLDPATVAACEQDELIAKLLGGFAT